MYFYLVRLEEDYNELTIVEDYDELSISRVPYPECTIF